MVGVRRFSNFVNMFRVIINFTIFDVATFSMCGRCQLISQFSSNVWLWVLHARLFIFTSLFVSIFRDDQRRQPSPEIVYISHI